MQARGKLLLAFFSVTQPWKLPKNEMVGHDLYPHSNIEQKTALQRLWNLHKLVSKMLVFISTNL